MHWQVSQGGPGIGGSSYKTSHTCAWTSVGGFPLLDDVDCGEGFDILRNWLTKCKAGHSRCGSLLLANYDQKIGVGSEVPPLFISNGFQSPSVALSHCWGKIKFLQTQTHNVATLLQFITVETLPKTF